MGKLIRQTGYPWEENILYNISYAHHSSGQYTPISQFQEVVELIMGLGFRTETVFRTKQTLIYELDICECIISIICKNPRAVLPDFLICLLDNLNR